jgi:hypothetical protein
MTTATNKTNIGTRRCTVASEEEVMGRMRLVPFGPTQMSYANNPSEGFGEDGFRHSFTR